MTEYAIINKTKIQEEINRLEKQLLSHSYPQFHATLREKQNVLQEVLNDSKPYFDVLKKAITDAINHSDEE